MAFPFVLAEGSIVFVIVLIISVISWIVNLAQGNGPKGKPRPRNKNAQSELEKFLQSVTNAKAEAEQQQERPQRERQERQERLERQEQQRQRNAQKQQQRSRNNEKKNRQKQSQPARASESPAGRPGEQFAKTHLETSVGAPMSSLFATSLDSNTRQDVDAEVQQGIVAGVQRDLGADGTTLASNTAEHPLIMALRNPQGVRQAIIMNEILTRPTRRTEHTGR